MPWTRRRRTRRSVRARRSASGARSWRAATTAACRETVQGRRLQPFIARFDLPREAFDDVIDGVAMDLDTTRYQTFEDLLEYCRRVASAVGLICIRIFGCRDRAGARLRAEPRRRAAAHEHPPRRQGRSRRGRVYLPLDDLAAAGCTVEDLAAGRMTPPVRRLHRVRVRPRARVLPARRRGAAGAGSAPAGRGGDHAGGVLRNPAAHRAQRLRRVLGSGAAWHGRVQALIALRQWLWPQ